MYTGPRLKKGRAAIVASNRRRAQAAQEAKALASTCRRPRLCQSWAKVGAVSVCACVMGFGIAIRMQCTKDELFGSLVKYDLLCS